MQIKVRGEIEQCLFLFFLFEKIDIIRFLDYQRICFTGVSDGYIFIDLDSLSMDDEEFMFVDSFSFLGVSFGVRFRLLSDIDSQLFMIKEVSDVVFEKKKDEFV